MPFPALAVAGGAVALGQALLGSSSGRRQKKLGKEQQSEGQAILDNLVRPSYQIPEEISQNLSQAENMALEGLPAHQKQQFVENMQRQQQQALNAQTSRKGSLAGIQ